MRNSQLVICASYGSYTSAVESASQWRPSPMVTTHPSARCAPKVVNEEEEAPRKSTGMHVAVALRKSVIDRVQVPLMSMTDLREVMVGTTDWRQWDVFRLRGGRNTLGSTEKEATQPRVSTPSSAGF
eukprot:1195359-Prorocentrum_minimum.AAC.4